MTISFKVCDVKEENVDMKHKETFNLNDFVESEVSGLIEIKTIDYSDAYENYKKQGKSMEEARLLIKNDEDKLKNERDELLKFNIKKAKVLQSSFKNDDNDNENQLGKDYIIKDYNSFVYSAWVAYNKHHHLEIRPENIWMAIITQFSFYVNKNSELLRDKFVDFQGKETLEVFTDYPILEAPFDKLTIDISKQIQKNIKDPSIKEWIVPNFSTTTESDKVIFSVALMSTMKKYFRYKLTSLCGLPKVTLHGTVADWMDLKERVQRLKEFDNKKCHMKKWVAHLLPIMDNFIQSANGTPNVDWWNRIIDVHSQSGGSIITGWLSAFCVFNEDGEYEDNKKPHFEGKIPVNFPKISENAIANGYVSVPVLLTDFDGTQYNSQLYAGHFTSKIEKSKLTPSLDWFIVANL